MEMSEAAKALSRKGVQVRTRERRTVCAACRKDFTTRSAKAQFCSRACFNTTWYYNQKDPTIRKLKKIHKMVKELIGASPRIDPLLKKIYNMLVAARFNYKNGIRLKGIDP